MQTEEFKGLTITLSDEDTKKLVSDWQKQHWRCIVYNKAKRTQMGFDIYGGGAAKMTPRIALESFLTDVMDYIYNPTVDDFARTFGYETLKEARKYFNSCEKEYFKARKFIGDDDEIKALYKALV